MSDSASSSGAEEAVVWHLVRHGETEWNRSRRIQGQVDVALNQNGRDQVARLGEQLSATEFTAIYASELSRTMESARLIRGPRDLAIEPVAELREFSYGEWEGLTFEEAEGRDPEGFAERMAGRNVDFAAPGGENMLQLIDRVRRFYDRALSEHGPGDHVMVVAHSGSLLALLNCLLRLPPQHVWSFRLDVASLSIVRTYSEVGTLELWNDTSHLSAAT